ncbi:MAG: 3-methyl-2-oxobutanoate dehydrogenase subunit VorB [Halanaerobiales bacterium]|nr:3-methyl-2-oxobutanoate dehydrogenase subunit VorB [Halanaerobiales bacterium]
MGKKRLMKGNEAIAEAAVQAGCQTYFGYPITPASEVIEYLSWRLPEAGGEFVQAESEVSAINMVYGAAAAGVRTMTATSSPGMSLKQEGISYISANELPCVIINVQRSGPGLGGLQPAQGDYFQAVKGGGHGDYKTIVLAPSTVQEAVNITQAAFDLADLYRNPVIVLTDGVLGQMMEIVEFNAREKRELPAKDWAVTGSEVRDGQRNIVTSYYLDPEKFENFIQHLDAKYKVIEEKEQRWEDYMTEDAEYLLVGFGLCGRVAKTTVQMARKEGIKLGLIRPITLWPFPVDAFNKDVKGYLTVELSLGQMVEDVRLTINGRVPVEFYGRQGGMVPTPEELLEQVKLKFGLEQK